MSNNPELSVELPWPDKVLNPNSRAHRMVKAAAKKTARELAYYTAFQAEKGFTLPFDELVSIRTFYPPDNRKRDLDNLGAMCKAYQDGIFDCYSEVDDSQIKQIINIMGEKIECGRVVIELYRMDVYDFDN